MSKSNMFIALVLLTALLVGLWLAGWYTTSIGIFLLCVVVLYWGWLRPSVKRTSKKRRDRKVEHGEKVGIYMNPTFTNFVLRPVLSLFAGWTISLLLYGIARLLGSDVIPFWAAIALGILFSLYFMQNDVRTEKDKDGDFIVVPKAYVGILTFFGERFRIYFTEGDHHWWGGKLGFFYSQDPLPNSSYSGEQKGFVFIDRRATDIWNGRKDKGNVKLEAIARGGSTIYNSLTVTLIVCDPLQWASAEDPLLEIAERSRSAIRTIVSFFIDFDNAMIKSFATKLMSGAKLITVFINEPVDAYPRGSVIQDHAGERIVEIIEKGDDEKKKINDLTRKIRDTADNAMLEASYANREKKDIVIEEREVRDHLLPVMIKNGAYFDDASVSSFKFSEEVEKQANIASAENRQRAGQIQNAKNIRSVQETLREGADQPGSELATMVALANEDKATIVYVPGASNTVKGLVAAGKMIAGNTDKKGDKK